MVTGKAKVRFNYEDYCLLPEDERYELIDGEFYVVPGPSYPHQNAVGKLFRFMADFVEVNGLGVVVMAPLDVIITGEDTVQPDILFVSEERRGMLAHRGCEGAPDMVVEVLSPSTAQRDRELKRKLYAVHGVQEYWLVNTETASVEIMSLGNNDFISQGTYSGEDGLVSQVIPGFALQASLIFAGV